MTNEQDEVDFNRRLKALFREQRIARGWTHREMAAYLGLPEPRYTAYETRVKSEIPSYLIPKFVTLTGIDLYTAMGMPRPKPTAPAGRRKKPPPPVKIG